MMAMMDPNAQVLEPTSISCKDNIQFYGTHANATGRVLGGDEMCVYTFDYNPYEVYVDGEKIDDVNNPNTFAETMQEGEDYWYNVAYSTYGSLAQFTTGDENLPNILVVGDSYTAPIAGLIASHHNNSYFVTGTGYLQSYGTRFNYDEFLEEHDIDRILYMITAENYFYEDEWGEIYKNFDIIRNEVE